MYSLVPYIVNNGECAKEGIIVVGPDLYPWHPIAIKKEITLMDTEDAPRK